MRVSKDKELREKDKPSMSHVVTIFFFFFYDVRWWLEEVRAVGFILMVGSQERCVEYWVDPPLIWQFQPIDPRAYNLRDGKGSVSFCSQLLVVLDEAQVGSF